jgi:hypothetical protein
VGFLWDSILGKLGKLRIFRIFQHYAFSISAAPNLANLAKPRQATSPTSSDLVKPRQTLDISKNRDSVRPEPARDDLAAEIVPLPPCVGISAALGRDPTSVSIQSVRQRHRIDRLCDFEPVP